VQQSAGNGDTTFGPYFAVEAYDDDANPGGDPALFGSLGVDAATGEVLYQAVGTGFLTTPVGNPTVAFGSWHDYMIELNFAADEYRIFLDNVLLAKQPLTAGFVDQAIIPGGLNEFTDADIATVAAAGNPASLALTGTAYYDNFLVEESNVACDIPEPTACVLAALGIMGVRGRRQLSRR